jgi:hypothetical protein
MQSVVELVEGGSFTPKILTMKFKPVPAVKPKLFKFSVTISARQAELF